MNAIVLAAGLAAWGVSAVTAWLGAPPLGHDEARYAIGAHDLLGGEPARWIYSSVGMNVVALPGVLAGGGELALRCLPTALGLLFVLAAARLARGAFGDATAAWAVAVLAGSFSFVRRASELLSDLPAAGCLLAGTAIVVDELTREPAPRRRLVLAAPWLAAAFYLRYGSILAIAVIAGAAVVGWRAALRRPWVALATAALFAALLVPHLAASHAVMGSPLGVLHMSSGVVGTEYGGRSLVTYVTSNPFTYYGLITAPVMLAGLAAIRRGRDRRVLMLWLIAVADIVAVGMTPVAQPRYIFFGVALLVILGADELRRWIAARPPAARRVLGGCAAAAVAASWLAVAIGMVRNDRTRTAQMRGTLAAVAAIRADAGGAPCTVIGRHATQLQWYTGCPAVYVAELETLAERRVYLVHEPGVEHQPERAGRPGVPRTILDGPDAIVTRYDPPPAAR